MLVSELLVLAALAVGLLPLGVLVQNQNGVRFTYKR